MRVSAFLLTLTLASSGIAAAASGSSDDATFLKSAQADVLSQYALASLAQQKATTSQGKALAATVATNADKANTWIKQYAKDHAIGLSDKPGVRGLAQYGDLQSTKGGDFDKTFAGDVYVDTQLSVSDFQDAAKSASDAAVRSFAQTQAKLLEQESAIAQKLKG